MLVHCYIYFFFSPYMPILSLRYKVGTIVILNTVTNFVVNAFFITRDIYAGARKSYLRNRKSRRLAKLRKKLIKKQAKK